MENNSEKHKQDVTNTKKLIGKTIILIGYAILLLFLYTILRKYSDNLIIVLMILAFILITLVGPLLKPKKSQQRLYKKMFPRSGMNRSQGDRRERRKRKVEYHESKSQKIKPVNLDYKYKKPLIKKCRKCNMILPSYVKKCPNCGEPLKK
ncbi:MAG: hypothetical protein ACOC4M_13700 [Promethearchaeia archaeon]